MVIFCCKLLYNMFFNLCPRCVRNEKKPLAEKYILFVPLFQLNTNY
jgi:hypothetical protein